ncbi:MAG: hypothetical protein FWE38_03385 [Firmicutes bacterium]|nr:hypothetical protein [Bacillota bacterium]
MIRMIIGTIILILTLTASILLYMWIGGENFDTNFDMWLMIAAVTFMLAAGIVIAGILFERGLRSRREDY